MNLKKIEPDDFNAFQAEIEKLRSGVERTQNLTWFYVDARFKIPEKDFTIYNVDGSNDGGLDCYFYEGNTFYLILENNIKVYHSITWILGHAITSKLGQSITLKLGH